MEIRLPMPLGPPRPSLDRPLSPSNICLQSRKEDAQRSRRNPCLSTPPPPPSLHPLPPQSNNPQYRFNHEGANASFQIVTTPKRREPRIFSLVHSAQREHSGNHSTNSSSFKEPRPRLSLVSKERKSIERCSSSTKKKPEDLSMGTLESFSETFSSLTLVPQQKENKKLAPAIMIKQPTLLKAHPLRSGKMNGSCMGKLIVQRALQDRIQNFPHPRSNIQQANSQA